VSLGKPKPEPFGHNAVYSEENKVFLFDSALKIFKGCEEPNVILTYRCLLYDLEKLYYGAPETLSPVALHLLKEMIACYPAPLNFKWQPTQKNIQDRLRLNNSRNSISRQIQIVNETLDCVESFLVYEIPTDKKEPIPNLKK